MLTALLLATGISFSPPVHGDVLLAGNFGEPRPHHFHGGIDVKTGGTEKKAIYSVADGYVSRVTTGLLGFGNAVYVTHPNGVTTVYCHLRSFSARIERMVRRWRYSHQCSFTTDARFGPTDCPVSEGQFIALSGNTGSSTAPHLHLEFHDTRTWTMLDPLGYLAGYVKDTTPPMAHGFMAYPQYGEGTFCGGSGKLTYGFTGHNMQRRFTAWGKVGFGIWANDYTETTYNHLGVYKTRLLCDGREVFCSVADSIPANANRQINIWGDYAHYLRSRVWYLRSFIGPGCLLGILTADGDRGIIDFNEQRTYILDYILTDRNGNESSYRFMVEGQPTPFPTPPADEPRLTMSCRRTSQYSQPGMQLILPRGTLGRDTRLQPVTTEQAGKLSAKYTFCATSCPLAGYAELNIRAGTGVADPSKLYLSSNRRKYLGGEYKDGWVRGMIRELGDTYEIDYDDTPPVITPIGNAKGWTSSGVIRAGLTDKDAGLKSYKASIDGRFVYFAPMEKSNVIQCRLKDSPVKKTGTAHTLTLTATDNRDNTATYTARFIW